MDDIRAEFESESSISEHTITSRYVLVEKETGRVAAVFYNESDLSDCVDSMQAATEAARRGVDESEAAEIVSFGPDLKEVAWRRGKMPSIGTKLYTQPPAPVVPCRFHDYDTDACEAYCGTVPCEPYPNATVVPEGFLAHLNSVISGVLSYCEPKQSEENQYIGGQAMEEMSRLESELAFWINATPEPPKR